MLVRTALPHDLAVITGIYDHAVRHGTASFELEPPDEKEMTRRFGTLRDGGYPYLVAEIEGEIAGYAYAGPYRARPAYHWTVEDSIYVAPRSHRRGVGRALIERLIAEAEAAGFRQMIAVIGDSANAGSIELHRGAGFRMVGTFDNVGFKFGRWLDSVLMQRPEPARRRIHDFPRCNAGQAGFQPCRADRARPGADHCPGDEFASPQPRSTTYRWRAARDRAHGRAARSDRWRR
jgi:phosphinothricin acetyltransferase